MAVINTLTVFLEEQIGLKYIVLALIRVYQRFISAMLPSACRFYPSCSMYMYEAIKKRGLFPGVYRGIKRLLKCHPFHPGGYDPP